jgi:hypothetical protein
MLFCATLNGCGLERRCTPTLVAIEALTTRPEEFAGKRVCTEGVLVSGFEASSLGPSTHVVDGPMRLTGPAIWVEQAEIMLRSDCFATETPPYPSYEFCRVRLCGRFDYGEKYGHGGCCDYQLSSPR